MVAHVLADLRDLHLLVQREEHAERLNRSRYVDRLAIAIVQIDHGNPPRATAAHRANASNVAVAALMIFAVDAPVRGSPSSHATPPVHLRSVPSPSRAKHAGPLSFARPSRRCTSALTTCPPRHAPSSMYRHPARSSTHDNCGRSLHSGSAETSAGDRPSARRSRSMSPARARNGNPSGDSAAASRVTSISTGT